MQKISYAIWLEIDKLIPVQYLNNMSRLNNPFFLAVPISLNKVPHIKCQSSKSGPLNKENVFHLYNNL